jgi:peptidoglycan L-alanyl-D-glutamate endopeptidase CwlK
MVSRKISDLTPRMQVVTNNFIAALQKAGLTWFFISCTYRSQIEQDAIYARGRLPLEEVNSLNIKAGMSLIIEEQNKNSITWVKQSIHTKREAVDFYIRKDGKYCNDLKVDMNKDNIPDWQEFGKIAKDCGLDWGGYWKTNKDYPHVQYPQEGGSV